MVQESDFTPFSKKMNFSVEDELASVLSKEITKQIDNEIIYTLKLVDIMALNKVLRGLGKLLPSMRKVVAHNGALDLPQHCAGQQFQHRLSWRDDLGASSKGWKEKLKRFRPTSPWSHHITYEENDAVFYFTNEEDQVQFLMLMR